MAQLVLKDLDPEVLGRLERRAKRLGLDLETAAARLLEHALANGEPTEVDAELEEPVRTDESLAIEDGLLVYTGSVSSADLDHRPSERSELVGSDGARSEGARRHFRGSGSSCHPASGTRRCTALVPGRRPMPC